MIKLTDVTLGNTPRIVPRFDSEPEVNAASMGPDGVVLPEPVVVRLKALEGEITVSDRAGLEARWNCGRELLKLRKGKKLPAGMMEKVSGLTGASLPELYARMKFAERYPDQDSFSNAVREFGSWHALVREGLFAKQPTVPRKRNAPALATRVERAVPAMAVGLHDREGSVEDLIAASIAYVHDAFNIITSDDERRQYLESVASAVAAMIRELLPPKAKRKRARKAAESSRQPDDTPPANGSAS